MPDDGANPAGQQQSPEAERSGDDARRRGWFWHWNTIITQYAPLVGLKGVGLLNSYTVWTDRREESPHHGYAFPSQQSEADFYGEDRAELITINKILVALGLIEIRKEMVLRVDAQGRRWKVPHNLYRVRDHRDGYNLTASDVLGVVHLAAIDRAVYRYIRRIFSPRFSPIDGDNVWHQMLPLLRADPCWQELAKRAVEEETRASARTRAGHVKRVRGTNEQSNPSPADTNRQEDDGVPAGPSIEVGANGRGVSVDVASSNDGDDTVVAAGNTGLKSAADESNSGSTAIGATIADERNEGESSDVDQGNTTYYETSVTTTTTTASFSQADQPNGAGAGPLPSASPAVVACFQAANGRDASPLEVELLAELEAAFDGCARRAGQSGSDWVVGAIREAVGSGSRFVAPKRLREILSRWSSERDRVRPEGQSAAGAREEMVIADVSMPDGRSAHAVWERALKLLSSVLDRDEMERLFAGSAIVGYQAGTVTVTTATVEAAERLSGEYYELVSRKLAEAMRRSVRIEFRTAEAPRDEPPASGIASPESSNVVSFVDASRPAPVPSFTLPGGLSNQQVWSSALERLATRVTPATLETWLRPASLIGVAEDGALVLGAPNAFAERRLSSRLLADIVDVLSDLLGRRLEVRVVVAQEWLRQQPTAVESRDAPADR